MRSTRLLIPRGDGKRVRLPALHDQLASLEGNSGL